MDTSVQKALADKLYDRRKTGALEYDNHSTSSEWKADHISCRLEALIRDCLTANDHDRIAKIVHQLCHDYAYAVHQPHARNGGLIGLAAAAIALGGVGLKEATAYGDTAETITGGSEVSARDRAARPCLLLGSRCKSTILCLRKHVQHCQGRQRGGPDLLQRCFRRSMQGTVGFCLVH